MKRQKLTKADVLAIRASDDSSAALSRKFGVSKTLIRDIRLGRKWKSVGGRIRVAAVAGTKWAPKPGDIEKAVAAIEETGAWSDGARAIGISDGTIKAYAGRNAEHGADLREAVAKGEAKTEAAGLESLKAALALRRVSRSWGAVAAELGLSTHRISYLSNRFGMREEYKAAADSGRAHWGRETIKGTTIDMPAGLAPSIFDGVEAPELTPAQAASAIIERILSEHPNARMSDVED
jgi:hypothetical protein